MSFPEEPLHLTSQEGFGYYPGRPGHVLNGGQYQIVRKLGFGGRSSVWLVLDLYATPKSYKAVKILTVDASELIRANKCQELAILEAVAKFNDRLSGPYSHLDDLDNSDLPALLTSFHEEGPHGSHICLVLVPRGQDLDTFTLAAPTKSLPLHSVITVIAYAAEGLSNLHRAGIIHGAIKPSNWLFNTSFWPKDIEPLLSLDPSIVESELEVEGVIYPMVRSQPVVEQVWNDDKATVECRYSVILKSFRHAQPLKDGLLDTQTGLEGYLQPPEVILGAGYDEKADIWALGCAIFELLTGRPLIMPYTSQDLEPKEYYLAHMASITGEAFAPQTLQRSPIADQFFDESGNLKVTVAASSIESILSSTGRLFTDQIPGTAAFLRDCLHLDPARRVSSADVVLHKFLNHAFCCIEYRDPIQ